jgi:hypothetical protein
LLQALSLSPDLACLSAILFRQCYLETSLFLSLSPSAQDQARACFLSAISPSLPTSLVNNLVLTLVKIYRCLNLDSSFLDLLQHIKSLKSDSLLLSFIELSQEWPELINSHYNSLNALAWDCLFSESAAVQLCACKVICQITWLTKAPNAEFSRKTLEIIKANFASSDLPLVLYALANIARDSPATFPVSPALVLILSSLSQDRSAPHPNRVAAIDLILTCDFLSLSESLQKDLLALSFVLMAELADFQDLEAWNDEIKDAASISHSCFSLGKDLFAHLVTVPALWGFALELVTAHMSAEHWVHQHAGVYAYGVLALEASDFLHLFPAVLAFLQATHPRVQWAALCTASALWKKHTELQRDGNVLSTLVGLVKGNGLRIQITALTAARCFFMGKVNDSDKQRLFFEVVFEVVNCSTIYIAALNETIALISELAASCSETFIPFVGKFVSALENIIKTSTFQSIRAAAVKSLSLLVLLSPSAVKICDLFSRVLSLSSEEDEVLDEAVTESVALLFEFVLSENPQLADKGFGFVAATAQTSIFANASTGQIFAQFEIKDWDNVSLVINANSLQKKKTACRALMQISSCSAAAARYSEPILNVASQMLTFKHNKAIRNASEQAIENVLVGFKTADRCFVPVLFAIFEVLVSKPSQAILVSSLQLLRSLAFKPGLQSIVPFEHFSRLVEALGSILAASCTSPSKFQSIILEVSLLTDPLSLLYPANFAFLFKQHLWPAFSSLLAHPSTPAKACNAVFAALCDCIEHTSDPLFGLSAPPLLFFIKGCYSNNARIRYNCAYGISLLIKLDCTAVGGQLDACIDGLTAVISRKEARTEHLDASELAACALARLSLALRPELIPTWASFFPLRTCPAAEIRHFFENHSGVLQQYGLAVSALAF